MPIVFAPPQGGRVVSSSADMTVSFRTYGSGSSALELTLSPATQLRLRYVDGDRVVVVFNETNKSMTLERVSAASNGYKMSVKDLKRGGQVARTRVGCTKQQAKEVMGDHRSKRYEFFEIDGNKVTFVEAS